MQETETNLRRSKRLAGLAFFIFCTLVILVGAMLFRHQRHSAIEAARDNLQIVHELYNHQIAYWRSQHITMARTHANNPALRLNVTRLLAARAGSAPVEIAEATENVKRILQSLKQNPEYHAVIVANSHGTPLAWMGISGDELPLAPAGADIDAEDARLCLHRREPLFSSIYVPENKAGQDHQHMNLLLPLELANGEDTFSALLVFVINPDSFLVPLLQTWPTPHTTAEAILVRRHDNGVVRVTDPKFETVKPLQPRVPAENRHVIGSLVQAGHDGFAICRDYRDEQVFTWIAPVRGAPWVLVTKIDQQEVMAPLKQAALYIYGVGGGAIILAALTLGMWWHQHAYRYRTPLLSG